MIPLIYSSMFCYFTSRQTNRKWFSHTKKRRERRRLFACTENEKTGSLSRSRARSSPRLNRLCIKHFGKPKKKVKQATISAPIHTFNGAVFFTCFCRRKSILLPFLRWFYILYFFLSFPAKLSCNSWVRRQFIVKHRIVQWRFFRWCADFFSFPRLVGSYTMEN